MIYDLVSYNDYELVILLIMYISLGSMIYLLSEINFIGGAKISGICWFKCGTHYVNF